MGKLFGTDGIRGTANQYPMTCEIVLRVGKSVARYFKEKNSRTAHRIVIGKDTRLSGYMIESALTSGIVSQGVDVLLVGPMPTPAIALLTKSLNCDAGIVLSASHNPASDNGIKIFSYDGFKLSDAVEDELEKLIFEDGAEGSALAGVESPVIGKAYRVHDAKGRYIEYVKSTIGNESLAGLKIVLDCANGATYSIAPHVFSELGADVLAIHNKPSGLNINLECGALYPESMRRSVEKSGADIGISLDGDGDRVIFCDETGQIVDGNKILGIFATELKNEGKLAGDTVVATKMANTGFDAAMKNAGIKVVKTDVGDKYVLEAVRNGNYNLGGEPNGHLLFFDYTTTDDGILVALQLLKIMKKTGKKLSELASFMQIFPQILININVKEKKAFEEIPGVNEKVEKYSEKLGDKGRVFLRYSGTENIARVFIEGEHEDMIKKIAEDIASSIKSEIGA